MSERYNPPIPGKIQQGYEKNVLFHSITVDFSYLIV